MRAFTYVINVVQFVQHNNSFTAFGEDEIPESRNRLWCGHGGRDVGASVLVALSKEAFLIVEDIVDCRHAGPNLGTQDKVTRQETNVYTLF